MRHFLIFFQKTTPSASKWQKDPAGQWRAYIPNLKEIVILRHLEWFFEKSEESRPHQNWPFKGGLLSSLFSKNPLSASKWQFLLKISTFGHFVGYRGKFAVLRHLEG